MSQVYDKFGLEATTRDFIGHSMALYQTDSYIKTPGQALETIQRIRLYANSMARYGKSPYIYPCFGLAELPQGFARLSAIYGGTYMLNTSIDAIETDSSGHVTGIKATMHDRNASSPSDQTMSFSTKTKIVIGDPSYFPGKTKVTAHVLRAICILDHPIDRTNNAGSLQLIIPQSQIGRKNDIYIAMVGGDHKVCPDKYKVAIVSTIQETTGDVESELRPGLERLGHITEKFLADPIPLYEPLEDGTKDGIFISKSYDATSHFETTTADVRDIYRRVMGEELVLEGLKEGVQIAED